MANTNDFLNFLETHDILIVDKIPSSRTRLLKLMIDLGCKKTQIHSTDNLSEAMVFVRSKNIGLILADYQITGGSGFDLFKAIREEKIGTEKLCLVLVTANISQTAVAKAAEEDVDSYVIKPYTVQGMKECLTKTITDKIYPSVYLKLVAQAKELIQQQDFDQAKIVLNTALTKHPRPALAQFYLGHAQVLQEQLHGALVNFDRGIEINKIHFKCLNGLYETLMNDNQKDQAYGVLKKLAIYFPANPERLTKVIHLAVSTGNFHDMKTYYDIFVSLDERDDELKKYIGAGLYISAKYSILNDKVDEAMLLLDSLAVSCFEFTKFLRAQISLLVANDLADKAEKYLTRFPNGSLESEDFLVSEFLIFTSKSIDPKLIVKKGLDLYNKGINDVDCIKGLMKAMLESGYSEDKIRPFRNTVDKFSA